METVGQQLIGEASDVAPGHHQVARQGVHAQSFGMPMQLGQVVEAGQAGAEALAHRADRGRGLVDLERGQPGERRVDDVGRMVHEQALDAPLLRVLDVGHVLDADTGRYQCVPSNDVLSRRLGPFFQADARVDKRWVYESWMFSLYLDVQNATNRKNPETVAYNHDYSRQGWMSSLPLFPSFGIRAEY